MVSIARSRGMFVNKDTCLAIKTSDVSISIFDRDFINSKLLFTWLLSKIKLFLSNLCINFTMGYKAVFTEETIILKGIFFCGFLVDRMLLEDLSHWRIRRDRFVLLCVHFSTIFDYRVKIFYIFFVRFFYWNIDVLVL